MAIVWALAAFAAAVAVHALLLRLPLKGDSVTKFALAGGTIGVALGLLLLGSQSTWVGLAALVIYALACELYTFLFTMVGTSVAVRILLTLREAPRTTADLEAGYTATGMVEGRIRWLQSGGLLDPATGAVTARGHLLARLFRLLKRFFRHPG